VLVGCPGDEYVCTHDHHACGDECLAFHFSSGFVDLIGGDRTVWRTAGLPTVAELMVLGELVQAAADGQGDAALDELGTCFARRFVEVVAGGSKKVARDDSTAPRGRRRAVEAAMRIDAPRRRPRTTMRRRRCSRQGRAVRASSGSPTCCPMPWRPPSSRGWSTAAQP
jgi:hypothetical protein